LTRTAGSGSSGRMGSRNSAAAQNAPSMDQRLCGRRCNGRSAERTSKEADGADEADDGHDPLEVVGALLALVPCARRDSEQRCSLDAKGEAQTNGTAARTHPRDRSPGCRRRTRGPCSCAQAERVATQRRPQAAEPAKHVLSQQRAEQQSAHPSWQAKSPASGPAWQDFCMGQENSTAEVLMERLRRGTRKSATAAQEQLSTPRSAHASAAHHQLGSASRRSPAGQVAPMGQGRQVPPARRLNSPPLQGSQKRRSEEACVPGGHGAMVKLPGAAEQGRA
jgi:hypothetical protein